MRIAAGVSLIIAAIFNIPGGAVFCMNGGVGGGVDVEELVEEFMEEVAREAAKEEAALMKEEVREALGRGFGPSGYLVYFGIFLMATIVVQIAAATMLFISKGKIFILIAAALSIIAELVCIFLFTMEWINVNGLVAGVLAYLAGMRIRQGGGAAPAPEAPMEEAVCEP